MLFLFTGITLQLNAQQAQIRAALDTNAILIGDQIQLKLQISGQNGINNPQSILSNLDTVSGIEVLEVNEWDTLRINNRIVFEQNITLTSFDSGYYAIPPLPIQFSVNGRSIARSSNQLVLKVNTLQPNSDQVAPNKDIIYEPLTLEDFYPYLLGLLAIMALGALIYYFMKRRKPKEEKAEPIIIRPAHEIALEKLFGLKKSDLWQNGDYKSYISQLTYIVREYLENRYEIQALESTTDEILRDLKKSEITENHRGQLQQMFQMADLVKFAKAEPPQDANVQLIEYSEDFIIQTKLIPDPEKESAA